MVPARWVVLETMRAHAIPLIGPDLPKMTAARDPYDRGTGGIKPLGTFRKRDSPHSKLRDMGIGALVAYWEALRVTQSVKICFLCFPAIHSLL